MVDSNVFRFLLLITILFGIWLAGYVTRKIIKPLSKAPETFNLIKLFVLTAQVIVALIVFTQLYQVGSNAILGLSALFGTTIGFALAIVIGNTVAGFYLITVRPFGIGDLIQVKGITAIVLEIGLNYTKLLRMDESIISIPNKLILDANVINCSIKIEDIRDRAESGFELGYQSMMEDIKAIHEKKHLSSNLIEEIAGGKEIVKYPLTVQLKLNLVSPDISLKKVIARLDKLCMKWDKKLGYEPRYFFGEYVFRQDTRIIVTVDEPMTIIQEVPKFLEDLYVTVFQEIHQEVKN